MGQTQTNSNDENGLEVEPSQIEHSADIRIGEDLIRATAPFAAEQTAPHWNRRATWNST